MHDEIFPIVDIDGNVTGSATRKECHSGSLLLHPVIHLHVFNSKGELFLQKRSVQKDIQPNLWDSSVGGHIDMGETPKYAAIREAGEEIGLIGFTTHFIDKHIIENEIEREFTYCFFTITDKKIRIDNNEVSDGRFWTIKEIEQQIGKNIFTFNFELDFQKFLSSGMEKLKRLYL